jgi:hypothetical protein
MTQANIYERRAYIKGLLESGTPFNIKDVARMWNSSYPSILCDIDAIEGSPNRYPKHPVDTQNIRARKLGVEGQLTKKGWAEVLALHNGACAKCGSTNDLCIDHIVPLSKGGTNTIDNVQPLCRRCNTSKGNGTPDSPRTGGGACNSEVARANGRLGGRPRRQAD